MADDPNAAAEGTLERRETPEQKAQADAAEVKLWLDALALSDKEEGDWRDEAAKVIQRYRGEKDYAHQRYRLLYANVQTTAPALFNTLGIPDIRRRFGDRDDDAKTIAQALERCVSCQAEKSDLESVMEEMTLHRLLPGRSVARVRHNREVMEGYTKESVSFEAVAWEDYRQGSAKRWEDVPWVAFRLYLTRDQIEDLVEQAGGDTGLAQRIPLNATVAGKKDGDGGAASSVFKRAEIWQFWDKDTKSLVYICPDFKEAPVAKVPDTLELEGFFPNPRPMLALRSPDSMVPVTEYSQYAKLAEDLERLTERLANLIASARAVGLGAKELAPAFAQLTNLKDGQIAASDEAFTLAQNGKVDDAIWFWPIEKIVAAIRELYIAREETKKTLYEVSGLSDILRGDTNANETLGAQRIKAQWGGARLQRAQADVARFNRDLYRLAVEIIATKFEPMSIMLASGVTLSEQQIKIMRQDVMREYRIDVETDSTIRADLSRHQENMAQFVQGLAAYVQAVGPMVQAGVMPGDIAAAILTGFARNFKLGKQAEDALDRLVDDVQQAKQQPKPPSPEEQAAQAEAQRQQAEMQMKAAEAQAKQQQEAQKFGFEQQKHAETMQFEREKFVTQTQLEQQKMQMDDARQREQMARDHEVKREGMMLDDSQKREQMMRKSASEAAMERNASDVADFAQSRTSKEVSGLIGQLAPALEAIGKGLSDLGDGQQAQAQATAQLAQAVGAETELVRDPTTGRAMGARKKLQTMVN